MVPFLGTLIIRCHIIIGTQKGTIILTSTQIRYQDVAREDVVFKELQDVLGQFLAAVQGLGFRVQGQLGITVLPLG